MERAAVVLALVAVPSLGCAGIRSETCARALTMRKLADQAVGEQKSVLEAKTLRLEGACLREQEKRGDEFRGGERKRQLSR